MGRAMARMQEMAETIRPSGWLPAQNGRVTLQNRTLVSLIATAYRVKITQVTGPPWMAELRFDVEARLPERASAGSANEMLQSLLEERFGLKVHRESRNVPGYALVVGSKGPKLKPAGSQGETPQSGEDMARNMAKAMAGGAGSSTQRRQLKNATAGVIAENLTQLIHSPVVDMTSLTGRYDVELEIAAPETPDDPIERRVVDAVAKLGLKLESRKVPGDVLVVDSVAKTPTPN
jgi:uncharacterized protein (TIGR03435 family)